MANESYEDELKSLVEWTDEWLDGAVSDKYKDQPLAQDWARVAKVIEEAGEAINALIGMTGQNPRKGTYAETADLLGELADVALTGIYAIQHFTKDGDITLSVILDKARYHKAQISEQATASECGLDKIFESDVSGKPLVIWRENG